MLKEERFEFILNRLAEEKKVLLPQISEALNVSIDTIRRDIKELDLNGKLKAVRGGAVLYSPTPIDFKERLDLQLKEKQTIANKALTLIEPGQVVIFDGGTTTLALAKALPININLTVVTNSFPVAIALTNHTNIEILFAGGRLFKHAQVTTGHDSIEFFNNIKANVCVLGICSIHSKEGITAPNYDESQVKKAMIASSQSIIALSSIEKLQTIEPYHIASCDQLDYIITDKMEEKKTQPFKSKGIEII